MITKQQFQTMRENGKSERCAYSAPCVVGSLMPQKVIRELIDNDTADDPLTGIYDDVETQTQSPLFYKWASQFDDSDINNLQTLQNVNDTRRRTQEDLINEINKIEAKHA